MAKILVVDDEHDIELLIQAIFRRQIKDGSYEFLFVNDGDQALKLLEIQTDIDVVLSDINMPIMDGIELLYNLKLKNYLLKTIVVSAYSDMDRIRSAMNLGAFDFIIKPISQKDLTITLEKTIQNVHEIRNNFELNARLQKEKDEADQSRQFKQQFLANMSHEIRTPMNAVLGFTNVLLSRDPKEEQIYYLDGIKKSSETLLNIINDILDLSKIEAGKIELESVPFNLRDIFDQVSHILLRKAKEKNVDIISEIDEKVGILLGDPTRLYQILMNLTGNAIKFTEQGSITMKAISSHNPNDTEKHQTIQFIISDTGIGIPKHKLNTIFENFGQANSSDTRIYGGTGLGLSITKQLVELFGGSIEVESDEGKGSKFHFTLSFPNADNQQMAKLYEAEKIDGSVLKGLNILVVDDNEYNRIVVKDTLEMNAQPHIIMAENGQEAIDALGENDIDLILLDVQMPLMNGYEVTNFIRNNFPKPKCDVVIIALTAGVLKEEIDKCYQAGMNGYIPKPFKTSAFLLEIANCLNLNVNRITEVIQTVDVDNTEKVISAKYELTNLNYLNTFCEGDENRIKKYVKLFVDSANPFCDKLESAIADKDLETAANQLHSIRTKLMMMGLNQQYEASFVLEEYCRNHTNIDEISESLSNFIADIRKASIELSNSIL